MYSLLAQIPTPTPFPPPLTPVPSFTLPEEATNLWRLADDLVQAWNLFPDNFQNAFQMVIIVFILVGVVLLLARIVNSVMNNEHAE